MITVTEGRQELTSLENRTREVHENEETLVNIKWLQEEKAAN